MNPKNKGIKINHVEYRFLPISQSVLNGLEPEPKITDFTLIKPLTRDSFSRGLIALHNISQVKYAIKAIDKRSRMSIEKKDYLKKIVDIMYRIDHPNIVKLYGHFEDNTYCYLLMEYMPNGNANSLSKEYNSKKISSQMVASIFKDIISAIYYLKHMSPLIILRSIKLSNILINSEKKAKLAYFGISDDLSLELFGNLSYNDCDNSMLIGILIYQFLTGNTSKRLQPHKLNLDMRWSINMDPNAVDLIIRALKNNPNERISLENMLLHPFFTNYFPDSINALIVPKGGNKIYIMSEINKDNTQDNIYEYNNIINDITSNTEHSMNNNSNIINENFSSGLILEQNPILNYNINNNQENVYINSDINKKILKLEEELISEQNKNLNLNKLISELKEINKNLQNKLNYEVIENKKIKEKNIELSNLLKNNENNNLLKSLFEKDKTIKELNEKLSRYPFQLNFGEKLISLIFILPEQVYVPIICKSTDKFFKLEEILYEKYEKYKNTENYFIVNGKRINRFLDLDANSIKDGNIIQLLQLYNE